MNPRMLFRSLLISKTNGPLRSLTSQDAVSLLCWEGLPRRQKTTVRERWISHIGLHSSYGLPKNEYENSRPKLPISVTAPLVPKIGCSTFTGKSSKRFFRITNKATSHGNHLGTAQNKMGGLQP